MSEEDIIFKDCCTFSSEDSSFEVTIVRHSKFHCLEVLSSNLVENVDYPPIYFCMRALSSVLIDHVPLSKIAVAKQDHSENIYIKYIINHLQIGIRNSEKCLVFCSKSENILFDDNSVVCSKPIGMSGYRTATRNSSITPRAALMGRNPSLLEQSGDSLSLEQLVNSHIPVYEKPVNIHALINSGMKRMGIRKQAAVDESTTSSQIATESTQDQFAEQRPVSKLRSRFMVTRRSIDDLHVLENTGSSSYDSNDSDHSARIRTIPMRKNSCEDVKQFLRRFQQQQSDEEIHSALDTELNELKITPNPVFISSLPSSISNNGGSSEILSTTLFASLQPAARRRQSTILSVNNNSVSPANIFSRRSSISAAAASATTGTVYNDDMFSAPRRTNSTTQHSQHLHGLKLVEKVGSFRHSADSEYTYAAGIVVSTAAATVKARFFEEEEEEATRVPFSVPIVADDAVNNISCSSTIGGLQNEAEIAAAAIAGLSTVTEQQLQQQQSQANAKWPLNLSVSIPTTMLSSTAPSPATSTSGTASARTSTETSPLSNILSPYGSSSSGSTNNNYTTATALSSSSAAAATTNATAVSVTSPRYPSRVLLPTLNVTPRSPASAATSPFNNNMSGCSNSNSSATSPLSAAPSTAASLLLSSPMSKLPRHVPVSPASAVYNITPTSSTGGSSGGATASSPMLPVMLSPVSPSRQGSSRKCIKLSQLESMHFAYGNSNVNNKNGCLIGSNIVNNTNTTNGSSSNSGKARRFTANETITTTTSSKTGSSSDFISDGVCCYGISMDGGTGGASGSESRRRAVSNVSPLRRNTTEPLLAVNSSSNSNNTTTGVSNAVLSLRSLSDDEPPRDTTTTASTTTTNTLPLTVKGSSSNSNLPDEELSPLLRRRAQLKKALGISAITAATTTTSSSGITNTLHNSDGSMNESTIKYRNYGRSSEYEPNAGLPRFMQSTLTKQSTSRATRAYSDAGSSSGTTVPYINIHTTN